jgi:uncharacterized protein (DUF4415 family)
MRGRPPLPDHAKRQVTLRLDPDVIERFCVDGLEWMNDGLRKAAGL